MYRFDEDWQAYTCADCDPTLPGFEEETPYDKPYVLLVPQGETYPEKCPRCGGYLSFTDGPSKLKIANTPEQRWAERREKESP